MSENPAKKIQCPTCESETLFSPENAFRPFCSERCRLIDLGEWFAETNAIPAGPADDEN